MDRRSLISGRAQALAPPVETFPWLIDGRLDGLDAERHLVEDPALLEPVGEAPLASASIVDRAVQAAHAAFESWSADAGRRRATLHHAADAVVAEREGLAVLLTREQGKPLPEARREFDRLALWLRHYADLLDDPEVIRDDGTRRIEVVRRPLGVVATITPWNFPISLLGWKLAPALAAGNTVVARPSLLTPLTTLRLGALLRDIVPPGVVNVVSCRSDVAERLVGHPLVRKVAFTGSTATGRRIMRTAGPALKRITLELGGNDAAIVLPDADVDQIAERLYWGAFYNCGQVCIAIKRLFVPDALHDAIVERLAARARSTRLGHGLEPDTEMGPLNNSRQRERIEELVAAARAAGGTIAAGGGRGCGPGWFHEPTIVTGLASGHALVDEEQFGPIRRSSATTRSRRPSPPRPRGPSGWAPRSGPPNLRAPRSSPTGWRSARCGSTTIKRRSPTHPSAARETAVSATRMGYRDSRPTSSCRPGTYDERDAGSRGRGSGSRPRPSGRDAGASCEASHARRYRRGRGRLGGHSVTGPSR